MKKTWWILALVLLLLSAAAFFIYTAAYYPAGEVGRRALMSDSVTVEETDFGWLFDGPSADTALIFYPGASGRGGLCAAAPPLGGEKHGRLPSEDALSSGLLR